MKLPPAGHTVTIPEWFTITGQNPYEEGAGAQFLVSGPMLLHLEENGPYQKYFDGNLIPGSLECPTAILEGLRRPNFADGLCYCLMPPCRWTADGEIVDPPAGKVFCVYLVPSYATPTFTVLDWEWRKVGPDATGVPNRWQRDFERVLWPTT